MDALVANDPLWRPDGPRRAQAASRRAPVAPDAGRALLVAVGEDYLVRTLSLDDVGVVHARDASSGTTACGLRANGSIDIGLAERVNCAFCRGILS